MMNFPRTSQKHNNFTLEPMLLKPPTAIPGMGVVYGQNLMNAGFEFAYQVYDMFLQHEKNKTDFMAWLATQCAAYQSNSAAYYMNSAYQAFKIWDSQFGLPIMYGV